MSRVPMGLAGVVWLLLIPPSVAAQGCWTCEVQYYPGDDCYIDSCYNTYEHGHQQSCSQQGSCGNEECTPYGGICDPILATLDGRNLFRGGAGMSVAELGDREGVVVTVSAGATAARLQCNKALLAVEYTATRAAELRRATRLLSI